MWGKFKKFTLKFKGILTVISLWLMFISIPKKIKELPEYLSVHPFPWIWKMLEAHGVLMIAIMLSIYVAAMDFRPWLKKWILNRKIKRGGGISLSHIINNGDEFSIETAIQWILGPNASGAASSSLHEQISDFLVDKHNAHIRTLADKSEGFSHIFFLTGMKSYGKDQYELHKRIAKSDLIKFCDIKQIPLPKHFREKDANT